MIYVLWELNPCLINELSSWKSYFFTLADIWIQISSVGERIVIFSKGEEKENRHH